MKMNMTIDENEYDKVACPKNSVQALFFFTLQILSRKEVGFEHGKAESQGKDFISCLCDLLWFLDPFWTTLEYRSLHKPELSCVLNMLKTLYFLFTINSTV